MKRLLLLLITLTLANAMVWSQAPVKRVKQKEKTEQTQQQREAQRKREAEAKRKREVEERRRQEEAEARLQAEERRKREEETIMMNGEGDINGHGYVDLGLPSGLKWAICNVGASSPGDYGSYYAWGETSTKSSYSIDTNLTYDKSISQLKLAGIIDSSGHLTMLHDAARANWGGSWRIPTKEECEELKEICTWTWTTHGGHNGYKVTGPNGKSIFVPAAGWRSWIQPLYNADEFGNYWGSTPGDDGNSDAYFLEFYWRSRDAHWGARDNGRSVRPVSE